MTRGETRSERTLDGGSECPAVFDGEFNPIGDLAQIDGAATQFDGGRVFRSRGQKRGVQVGRDDRKQGRFAPALRCLRSGSQCQLAAGVSLLDLAHIVEGEDSGDRHFELTPCDEVAASAPPVVNTPYCAAAAKSAIGVAAA